jgi:hypothetical protein
MQPSSNYTNVQSRMDIRNLLNSEQPRETQASSSTPRGDSLRRQNTNTHHTHFSSGGSASRPPVPPPEPTPVPSPTDARRAPPKPKRVYPKTKKCPDPKCNLMFAFDAQVKLHFDAVHEKIKHRCDVCGLEFTRAHNLRNHKQIHEENQPKYCNLGECKNVKFREKKGLDRHIRAVHKKERPYTCLKNIAQNVRACLRNILMLYS